MEQFSWSSDPANVTCNNTTAWSGVSSQISVTPYGHETAISCHNCYMSSLSSTLTKISAAKSKGANLIELDVSDEGGTIYVHHDDGELTGPTLSSVLSDGVVKNGTHMLFIEIKETAPSDAFISDLLTQLMNQGYGTASRPVFLRTFYDRMNNLLIARRLLATSAFASMRNNVRLHVLFSTSEGNNIANLQNKIKLARERGMHGVEFEYHTKNIFGAIDYAKSLHLGTSLWTIPSSFGEVFVAAFRDEVDSLTVEYPIDKARNIVSDDNGLMYVNLWEQPSTVNSFSWFGIDATDKRTATLAGASAPSLMNDPVGEDRFGTSALFQLYSQDELPMYDGDNQATHGFFVAAYVNFNKLNISDGTTAAIVSKANSGGFALELHNPTGSYPTILRFGVRISGEGYRYASAPVSSFANGEDGFFIIGAYDGNGAVRMWIDGSSSQVTSSSSYHGGVVLNDVPITLGADPENGPYRYHFDGIIQMALVQDWADH